MRKSYIFTIAIIMAVLTGISETGYCSEATSFKLDFGGWYSSLNARAKSGKGAGTIDVMGDLGLDERKTIFPISVDLNIGGPYHLFADFYSYSISGDKILDEALSFNSVSFAASTTTSSKYKHDAFRTGLRYRIASRPDANYSVKAGFLYYKLKLDISNSSVSTSETLNIPFLFLGADLENKISPNFAWGGLVDGMALSFQDYTTTYFNFDIYLKYFLMDNLSLKTSYRYENIDSEKEEVSFNTESSGVYLGLNVMF